MKMFFPPFETRPRLFWLKFVLALSIATVLPIGIHTVMLDGMGIPYPSAFPRGGWSAFPDHVLIVLGALYLDAALSRDRRLTTPWRLVFVFLSIAAINQALFRLPVMLNAVSSKWTIYRFVDNLPTVLRFAAVALLVVATNRMAATTAKTVAAAMLIALAAYKVVAPTLDAAFAGIIAADATREGDQLYNVPYDWHVNLPSYLTYIEPALGAFAVALILGRLRVRGIAIVAILFAMQGGPLFGVVLNVVYANTGPGLAMLSKGQFSLEALALATLAAATSLGLAWKPFPSAVNEVNA